jgi:tetratricopeptide (TPR) repeat protein
MGQDDAEERIQRASDALEKASLYGPALAETLAATAEYIYRVENDFHRAAAAFTEAVKANPGDPRLLIRLGVAQRRTGMFEAAVSSFQLAIELDPANIEGRSLLVGTLSLMGEYERAEPLINLWIEKYPHARDIRANKTDVLVYQHGDLKAARVWFDGLEPAVSNAYLSIGAYLPFLERDYQAVIDFWSKHIFSEFREHKSRRIYIDTLISRAYHYLGNEEKANEYAQSVIDLVDPEDISNPSHWDELLELAKVLAYQGEFARALEYSGQVIREFPIERDSINGAVYLYTYTQILGMSGRRDEALVEIERLLKLPAGMSRWELYLSPDWDFFRDDERFNELARPLNLEENR